MSLCFTSEQMGGSKNTITAATGKVVNANKVKLSESTGIVSVKGSQDAKTAIYNLNGQKVQKAQKGLYIQNGRKVVIK